MISLIVAMDRNGLIGLDGSLPWDRRSKDLKNFKELTIGNTVVMGRKTYESIGGPLWGRDNVIITKLDEKYKDEYQLTFGSAQMFKSILDAKKWPEQIFIIGGASIYREFAHYIERMYITVINDKFSADGEAVYFPWTAFLNISWKCVEQKMLGPDFYYVFDKG